MPSLFPLGGPVGDVTEIWFQKKSHGNLAKALERTSTWSSFLRGQQPAIAPIFSKASDDVSHRIMFT